MRSSGSTTDLEHSPWPQTPALARFHFDPELAVQNPDTDKPFSATRTAAANVSFGPFRLLPTQFLLLEGNKPVPLGSRALEILIVLLARPGELISKQELMDRVWPNVFVGPANLTVHMSALRRALRDGRSGNRFIINIPGRGYKFVASVAAAEIGRNPQTKLYDR
jgi:DNA-binding winged helix-turn-helix (wHTH) protein